MKINEIRGKAAAKFSRKAARRAAPNCNPAKRLRFGEEGQRNERAFGEAGSEGYGACPDEGAYWFRRGYRSRNSERMRLTSLKRATYKLKNDDNVVLAAA